MLDVLLLAPVIALVGLGPGWVLIWLLKLRDGFSPVELVPLAFSLSLAFVGDSGLRWLGGQPVPDLADGTDRRHSGGMGASYSYFGSSE